LVSGLEESTSSSEDCGIAPPDCWITSPPF
jgi:hypothetical protein